MTDEDSQIGKEMNLQFTSNGTADNIRDNDCGSAKPSDTVSDYDNQNINPWTMTDSYETSLINASHHNQVVQPTKFSSNRAVPRAWQPPIPPQVQVTEVDEPYPTSFEKPPISNYFDPFDINPPTQTVRPDVRDSSGFVSFPEKKKEAKKVCKQISRLLRDKSSRARGSRMFQKRRKRAEKFTIVGYGTQPVENEEKYLSESEDSGSQASTGLDCGTDDEIPAYDSCGLHNVLTEYDTLSPSQQILHNQLKNLAMDVGTMRGKGAKIFAKCQQRMEKFVITDENRRQNNNFLVENKQNEAFQEAVMSQRPPYIRPGSSIGIGTNKTIARAQPNATKYNRNVSGYCTDFEDDSTRSRNQKPQINYFSDCETSVVTDKPRRTRPSNRRAWDPREETDNNNNYVDSAPASKEVIASYSTVVPGMLQPVSGKAYAGHEDVNSLPATAIDNTRMFRSVRAPTLTAQTQSFVKPFVPEMVAKNQVFIPRVGANTSSNGPTASGNGKTWSRVNFCPRKPAAERQSSPQVVQYPCNRQSIGVPIKSTSNLPPSPAKQKTQKAYQLHTTPQITSAEIHPKPSQRPNDINPLPTVSRSQTVPQKEDRILKQEKKTVNCNLTPKKFVPSVSNGNIGYKPKPAMVLLGQPMENISKPWKSRVDDFVPDKNNVVQLPPSEFIDNVSQMENEEGESSPYTDSNGQNVNEAARDFVHSENGIENNASNNDSTSSVESIEILGGNQINNYPVKEEDKAKVIKCCPQTFISTLPSRCFSPPVRPNIPTQNMQQKFSPKLIKIATTNSLAEQYPPSKSSSLHSGPVPTGVFSTPKVDSDIMEESGKQTAKVSACLKVLDPTRALFQPKQPPAPIQPSPTLCAVMQSENDVSYGAFKTPSISYQPPVEMASKPPPPPPPLPPVARLAYNQRPVRYQSPISPSSPKSNGSLAKASPQPLGIIADSMKGKGAKMFAKQQQRMERYTKETSVEDFPGLQEARMNGQDDFAKTVKTSNEPRPMPGFAKNGKKIELGEDTKKGMMKVLGEFQKGKVKRPSDARKKGRDPLHYQQYLSYRPPSAADFVEPTADSIESYSDSSSVASSMTNTSSLASSLNQDSRKTFCPEPSSMEGNVFPSSMSHDDSTATQIYQASPNGPPRVAPKPSRAVITRQLSKPTSPPPPPVVAVSPSPEIYVFKASTATPSPKGDKTFVYPSLNGGTVAGPESNEPYSAVTNGVLEDLSCYPYPLGGIAPPSYQEVTDDTVKYRSILKNGQRIEESATSMDEIDINHNMKATISKPLYNSEGNGVSVKIIIPQ